MARYSNILETVGNTPLIQLNALAPEGINLYVKVEAFNPMGSVKDRMAKAVIEHAEATGALKPGQTVIEATSGNTGIGLAMVCAQKGYPLVIVMAENFSIERRKMLRFLGAKVVLTPASEKGTGMMNKAAEMAKEFGWFLCRQFENDINAEVHRRTTARELLADFNQDSLDYWVSGYGTGGTLLGVASVLKAESPTTQIIVAEPDNSPVLASGIPQQLDDSGQVAASHPEFKPHLMQGWAPDFISGLTSTAVGSALIDQIMPVAGNDALQCSKDLARKEGIFAGISSGATLAAAIEVARDAPIGSNIVCMLPDTGERYLSTPLFEDIAVEMTEEEMQLSQSTPLCQFQVPKPSPATNTVKPIAAETLDLDAEQFVRDAIQSQAVVMFSLEWCEFCWSARKLFTELGVEYRSVDLDSVEFQSDGRAEKIRAVLRKQCGQPTIPQIFIAGQHIGGCSELFDSFNSGTLYQHFDDASLSYNKRVELEPTSLLPKWLHPRISA